MAVTGFKLVSEGGQLRVAHGHGHYHTANSVLLRDIGDLIDTVAKGKTDAEVYEIKKQVEQFYWTVKDAVGIEDIKQMSSILDTKIKKI
ncbi:MULTISPECIES: hypothetical protein [unclassified Pseudodesulfovibrio]|uniref:hypothetical protein n=1 Tax=unclassified Pseudodesulfovibrio TaxID=2661612 RepID=UPI000FEBE154|nr:MULTISPECIES: hypothetical protein [unclassified Pseudodesulfovibrio]MCJ2164928.1 hypothetical protein [Pseudodesulfovibrio sp. S3-i]RWU03709.1 hypothetical protein DWB63_09615 [Pseudodesulfovibrio sp. S3]